MRIRPLALAALCILAAAPAAAREYPADELRDLVDAGTPPAAGEAETVREEPMAFEACVASKKRVLDAARADYPVVEVLRSPGAEIDALWSADGVVRINCSRASGTMTITRAPYR
ncbi:hypothetical protein [Coralloluteibacterium stylophorae]|uniref:Uncharacterized protein n=1 Tax=Coralloluteibacterium stylophorae TaxID=1776034 RepID=A0A8J7VUL8_9GAMM|nr:hypothetical protein [Coralloluteibacterium stylophorae]MBS7458674.1 hypothetical protein [Coralloluteibacterium stylophorae]